TKSVHRHAVQHQPRRMPRSIKHRYRDSHHTSAENTPHRTRIPRVPRRRGVSRCRVPTPRRRHPNHPRRQHRHQKRHHLLQIRNNTRRPHHQLPNNPTRGTTLSPRRKRKPLQPHNNHHHPQKNHHQNPRTHQTHHQDHQTNHPPTATNTHHHHRTKQQHHHPKHQNHRHKLPQKSQKTHNHNQTPHQHKKEEIKPPVPAKAALGVSDELCRHEFKGGSCRDQRRCRRRIQVPLVFRGASP